MLRTFTDDEALYRHSAGLQQSAGFDQSMEPFGFDEATDGNLGAHLSTPNVLLATRDLFHAVLPANQGFERPSNHHLVMGARSI